MNFYLSKIINFTLFWSLGLRSFFKYFYYTFEDLPSSWNQKVEVDFIKKELKIDDVMYSFHEIYRIIAHPYESGIFPTYYKIWLELEKGEKIKMLSLKEADGYTYILKGFHDAGVPVN